MPPERRDGAAVRLLALWGVTFGDAALASFVVCAVSGVFLSASFDVRDGAQSIGGWLLVNPGAVYLRNLHYWTAQAFLVLTVLHGWDHLRLATERKVGRGIWLRLVLSLPVIAFVMLSGFLLRGDADAQQARRILEEVITLVPLVGPLAATFLFGADGGQLQVVYVQHAATATIIVWLVIIEHARRIWPGVRAAIVGAVGAGVVSLFLSPGLHDGLDPVLKGPWYFLGLQEVLHWTSWPVAVVAFMLFALIVVWWIPRLAEPAAMRVKVGLFYGAGAYLGLCAVGLFLRGENWGFAVGWPGGPGDLRAGPVLAPASIDAEQAHVASILGRAEGCMACHADVTGFSPAHQPESIGCASCHLGDTFTLNKDRAHRGMVLVPGNLADAPRTCGQAGCHASIVPRVERSLMATFSGVISANRRVFGESIEAQDDPPHVRDLGVSAADSHLRQLCASCHLGQSKTEWGPITQESRGGGCNACHLRYSPAAAEALAKHEATPLGVRDSIPKVHPALSVQADGDHCFGCHSRSSRISTSYEGWHELKDAPAPAELAASGERFRQLDDGRTFVRVSADVHHEQGLDCIDCHTALEVMGTGATVAHKSESLRVRCEDCHAARLGSQPLESIDPEAQKIFALRRWALEPGERIGTTRGGDTLINVVIDVEGRGRMRRKSTGETAPLRAPASVCTEGAGHDRLSCASCHTPWAPRCANCHTSFDPKEEGFDHLAQGPTQGAWMESSRAFQAAPPTLGIRSATGVGERGREVVDTFVPGMILTIDRNMDADRPADTVSRRLYAPIVAHTTRREARSCVSCHNDPVALGYGEGALRFETQGATGRWRFEPSHPVSAVDGLPEHAWTGFLAERSGMVSSREGVRPFSVDEQRRILTAAACLTCHAGDSAVMQESVRDFRALVLRRSAECVIPVWD